MAVRIRWKGIALVLNPGPRKRYTVDAVVLDDAENAFPLVSFPSRVLTISELFDELGMLFAQAEAARHTEHGRS
jgi:hypothetical protein